MRKLIVTEPRHLSICQEEPPVPGPGEVGIRVAYCGICGSDIHAFQGKHPFISLPFNPGHEFSGTVFAVGKEVSGFTAGDRVVCEPNLVCGKCPNCRTGRYNICDNLKVMGCQSHGAMADCFLAPQEKTLHLPQALSLRDAVLVEPLSVGVHAVRVGGALFNRNVAIFGAGTIGLMVLVNVMRAGAKDVAVVDLSEHRLHLARKLGASCTFNAGQADLLDRLQRSKPDEGYEVIFECVGVEKSVNDAVELVRKGGRIVVCGVFADDIRFKVKYIQDREIEMVGSLMYTRRDVQNAIDLLASGRLNTSLIISREYPLDRAEEAFAEAVRGNETIKVILNVSP